MKGWILFFRSKNSLTHEDYSLNRLVEAAEQKGIEIEVLSPSQCEIIMGKGDQPTILIDGKEKDLPDFVLPRMGCKTPYFGLTLLRQLEYHGVICINTAGTVRNVGDKLFMGQLLSQYGLPIPKTMLVKAPLNLGFIEEKIGFPAVIKDINGTSGRGVHLCESAESFSDLMDLIYINNPNAHLIIQEFIASSRGKDIRVFVVGGKIIGCMQRTSKKGFKANVSLGGTVAPYPLDPELAFLTKEVTRLLDLDVAGIDFLMTASGYTICEANSSPGFIGMEKVTGQVIAEEIMEYIQNRVIMEKQCAASSVI